jgi:hypothetical protein
MAPVPVRRLRSAISFDGDQHGLDRNAGCYGFREGPLGSVLADLGGVCRPEPLEITVARIPLCVFGGIKGGDRGCRGKGGTIGGSPRRVHVLSAGCPWNVRGRALIPLPFSILRLACFLAIAQHLVRLGNAGQNVEDAGHLLGVEAQGAQSAQRGAVDAHSAPPSARMAAGRFG